MCVDWSQVKTTIGFGSPNKDGFGERGVLVESAAAKADSHDAHGAPLGADEAEARKKGQE